MSESFLGLRYEPDGDGTGLLRVHVQAQSFSGQSQAWFGDEELLSFAKDLATTFPIASARPLVLRAGLPDKPRGTCDQQALNVSISVYPVGTTGAIGVRVELSSPIYDGDRSEARRSVGLELITRYGPLQEFADELISVVHGKASHAKLVEYEP